MSLTRRHFVALATAATGAAIAGTWFAGEQTIDLSKVFFVGLALAPNGTEPVAVFRELGGEKKIVCQTRAQFLEKAAPGRSGADALQFAMEGGGRENPRENANIFIAANAFTVYDEGEKDLPTFAALKEQELKNDQPIRSRKHCDTRIRFCQIK